MAKIIAVCGKICSGKTYYAEQLRKRENAVILSCDELTWALFDNNLGEKHDEMTARIRGYLAKKAAELAEAGCTVILDWGFWRAEDRRAIEELCLSRGIRCERHYVDADDETWQKNIEERNSRVLDGRGGSAYYLDEGLMNKLQSLWEEPSAEEIDVRHRVRRTDV